MSELNKQLVTNFIEENIELIEAEDFEQLYNKAIDEFRGANGLGYTGMLTYLLEKADIYPLLTLSYVPNHYMGWDDELISYTIPPHITSIKLDAFNGCKRLKKLSLPPNLISIGDGAFYQCESLEEITLPKTLRQIDTAAFGQCTNLKYINYEGTLKDWQSIIKPPYWIEWHITKIRCIDGEVEAT